MSANKNFNEVDKGLSQFDERVKKLAFYLAIILMFLGVYKIMMGHTADASLSLVSGFFSLLFTKIESLKSISALGLKAELHEKLVEADALIERLRKISLSLTEIIFSVMARSGTYQQLSRYGQYEYVKKITEQLTVLGVSEPQIDSAKKDYYYIVSVQMAWVLARKLEDILRRKSQQLQEEWEGMRWCGPLNVDQTFDMIEREARSLEYYFNEQSSFLVSKLYDQNVNEPYSIVSNFLARLQGLTEKEKKDILKEIEEELMDLKCLVLKHEFRRPGVWFSQ